jgi:porin
VKDDSSFLYSTQTDGNCQLFYRARICCKEIIKFIPIISTRNLGSFCALLCLLVFLPPAALGQSLKSSTPVAAIGSLTSAPPGGQAAQAETDMDINRDLLANQLTLAVNPRALSGGYYSGLLQKALGLSPDSPVKFGGVVTLGGNWLASGGLRPGATTGDFVLGLGTDIDAERLLHIPGGEFFTSGIVYEGADSNGRVGSVQVYDNLAPPKDFHRLELYELWWRQRLFEDKLIAKIGKINAGGEFGQVLIPAPTAESNMRDWTVSDLLYTPSGLITTNFKMPIYPNPAWGVAMSFLPTKNFYASYGLFDGNGARGEQTGVKVGPEFNSYKFHIGEAGYAWRLGNQGKPGRFAAGIWRQTGDLATGTLTSEKNAAVMTNGATGYYAFGYQRLWYRHPGTDPSGLIGFTQFGHSDSHSNTANWYAGGGLTALGLVPCRPSDTTGVGIAWSKLNSDADAGLIFYPDVPSSYTSTSLRTSELMLQVFYQLNLIPPIMGLQAAYTAIPTPGYRPGIPWANVFTLRLFVVL